MTSYCFAFPSASAFACFDFSNIVLFPVQITVFIRGLTSPPLSPFPPLVCAYFFHLLACFLLTCLIQFLIHPWFIRIELNNLSGECLDPGWAPNPSLCFPHY
ncbi:uncharacterized protein BO97DRAFT_70636 [Aspergillus homomorphus CBS 101889]|uniref:Uncharacterized protein n=1 Tax=Aspergillus homomorphus (strain CBS 101889) TaxID=1450537 RepID=A0A395HWA6_ASPHC|nr:hypothetical protein BO97DRAFT_70636 [Aspergillus homomorphus CBS 101889]RAL12090.1 hypothetical protein BO97DRAFT_70636 [Aspergillus homomorphus CBS 101889]